MIDRQKFKNLVLAIAASSAVAQMGAGCSSSGDAGGKGCTAGDTKACACPGGPQGAQTCKADGSGFGECTGCPSSGGSGGSAAGGATSSGGTSSGGTTNSGGAAGASTGGTVSTGGVMTSPSSRDAGVVQSDAGGSACGACTGCCDETGTCVPPASQSAIACGVNAGACIACNTGEICVAGQCQTASTGCSPSTCPTGCCVEGSCILPDFQNSAACGAGGLACNVCTWGVLCAAGSCTTEIDSNAGFYIAVDEVQVKPSDPSGTAWDFPGGLADPFVCFSDGIVTGCTPIVQDNDDAVWTPAAYATDASGKPVLFSSAQIMNGSLQFSVYDSDVAFNDLIQSGAYSSGIFFKQPAGYATTDFGSVILLKWRLLP